MNTTLFNDYVCRARRAHFAGKYARLIGADDYARRNFAYRDEMLASARSVRAELDLADDFDPDAGSAAPLSGREQDAAGDRYFSR